MRDFRTRKDAEAAWTRQLSEAYRVLGLCDSDDQDAIDDAWRSIRLAESQIKAAREGLLSEES